MLGKHAILNGEIAGATAISVLIITAVLEPLPVKQACSSDPGMEATLWVSTDYGGNARRRNLRNVEPVNEAGFLPCTVFKVSLLSLLSSLIWKNKVA